METIDARGLSCPEPVLMLRAAMQSNDTEYTLITDNLATRENTLRFGEHKGYAVAVTETAGEYTLYFTKR